MYILVVNAGSSSLKYQLFDTEGYKVLAKGLCERIGIDGRFKYTAEGKGKLEGETPMKTHADAIKVLISNLLDENYGVIKSMSEIGAVGHRVLHGGTKFSASVLVNDTVKETIKECFPLGPLHNPANLTGILACEEVLPGVPQVAVFDTAFHQTMPDTSYMYSIPYEYYEKYSIRRYGFHGSSHKYVSGECVKLLGGKAEGTRIITCHLGNGSSLAAVKDGKCFDTSMGLTPLEGLPMGTRSGSIDPAIVEFLCNNENLTPSECLTILNKKSGALGISGVSSDYRDLTAKANEGDYRSKLAIDIFRYNIIKLIGSYTAALGGADAIVFTAGVGENDADLRSFVCKQLAYLGITIDEEKNKLRGETVEISTPDSKVRVFVIPTNEELVIARDTEEIVSAL